MVTQLKLEFSKVAKPRTNLAIPPFTFIELFAGIGGVLIALKCWREVV